MTDDSAVGRALFLVGPSSTGKTTLGHELIERLPDPFILFEVDRFGGHLPRTRPELLTLELQDRMTRGGAMAVRGYLDAGVNLVVEWGLWAPRDRRWVAEVLSPYPAWLIGLRWRLDVLEAREERRSDVRAGTARGMAEHGSRYWDLPFDLMVDNASQTPEVAALEIVTWFADAPPPTAISDLADASR